MADKWNDFVSIISVESSWEQSLKTKMTNLASLVQFIRNHISAVGDIEQIVSRNNCESRANLNQRSEQLSLQIITFSTMTQCSSRLCSVLSSHPPAPPPLSRSVCGPHHRLQKIQLTGRECITKTRTTYKTNESGADSKLLQYVLMC